MQPKMYFMRLRRSTWLIHLVHCCSGLEEVLGVQLPQDLSTDEARDTLAKLVSHSLSQDPTPIQLCYFTQAYQSSYVTSLQSR